MPYAIKWTSKRTEVTCIGPVLYKIIVKEDREVKVLMTKNDAEQFCARVNMDTKTYHNSNHSVVEVNEREIFSEKILSRNFEGEIFPTQTEIKRRKQCMKNASKSL